MLAKIRAMNNIRVRRNLRSSKSARRYKKSVLSSSRRSRNMIGSVKKNECLTSNGCPAGEAHLFGKVPQQRTERRVRARVELERNRGEVAVVEQRPQLGQSLASYSEMIDATREALGIDGSRTAAGGILLLLLVGVWRGSAVGRSTDTGRARIAAGQRVRLLRLLMLLLLLDKMMREGTSVVLLLLRVVMRMLVLVRNSAGTIARGWVLLQVVRVHLVNRFGTTEATGSGDHLPAAHRERRGGLLPLAQPVCARHRNGTSSFRWR